MRELKPCPFCGEADDISLAPVMMGSGIDKRRLHAVECGSCAAMTESCYTESDAIDAWNRRAPAEDGHPDVERLRVLVEECAKNFDALGFRDVAAMVRGQAAGVPTNWVQCERAPQTNHLDSSPAEGMATYWTRAEAGHPDSARTQLIGAVAVELDHAYTKHGREPWGRHEFYAILKEEVDELWDDIKADAPTDQVLKELVQVAAMCFRYAETGDRYRGEHPAIPRRDAAMSDASRQGKETSDG